VTIDIASIDAWLVGGRDKPKILQDGVDVTLPETMGFGVALKGSLNREDVSVRYRGASEMCISPALKDMVDPHVESLRRRRSFCEVITDIGTVDALVLEGAKSEEEAQAGLFHAGCITDIGTLDALVLEGAKSEEEAQAGLFHAGCVGAVKSTKLATTSRTVSDATGLFRFGLRRS
jgi:hypothetical protein